MGTIFADDAGASSAGEQCDDEPRSVFRDSETTTDRDGEPGQDDRSVRDSESAGRGEAADGADASGEGAVVADEEAVTEARTMLVFSGGERREFEVDEQ